MRRTSRDGKIISTPTLIIRGGGAIQNFHGLTMSKQLEQTTGVLISTIEIGKDVIGKIAISLYHKDRDQLSKSRCLKQEFGTVGEKPHYRANSGDFT